MVQNDAKLMPYVVQGGREVPRVAGLPACSILKGGSQPGGILGYFEDLNQAPNAELGSKDFFETASINITNYAKIPISCRKLDRNPVNIRLPVDQTG